MRTLLVGTVGGLLAVIGFASTANANATIDLLRGRTSASTDGVETPSSITLHASLAAGPGGSQGADVTADFSAAAGPLPLILGSVTDTGSQIRNINAASIPPFVGQTVATASYDRRVYLAVSLACLVACSLLFWDLLGSQVRALLVGSQLALRRWNSTLIRPYWAHTNPLASPMRKTLLNSVTKVVIPRPKP
jgi:hypothetical protein